jgi:hypothetical protein
VNKNNSFGTGEEPAVNTVFERLILKRLEETVPINDIISMHQFGFRTNHSTIQQCHRIINKILVKESMYQRLP